MSTAIQITGRDDARKFLEKMRPQMEAVLPKVLPPERLVQVTMLALSKNPQLYACTPKSLAVSVMECATLGLVPDGVAGHAYLIPFKSRNGLEAKLIPGYRGLVTLARRAGVVLSGHPVYEKDLFEYEYGMDERLIHRPYRGADRGPLSAAYAVARQDGMAPLFIVLEAHEIESIKARSRGSSRADSPWNHEEDRKWMWTKSAIRALAKFLDLTPDLARAIELDVAADAGEDPGEPTIDLDALDLEDPPAEEPKDELDSLAESIGGDQEASEPEANSFTDNVCRGCGEAIDGGGKGCENCGMAIR